MNEDKVIEVFAQIENEREAVAAGAKNAVGFDMATWYSNAVTAANLTVCRTVACFAGHTLLMNGFEAVNGSDYMRHIQSGNYEDIQDMACKILGLSDAEGSRVFYLNDLDEVYGWFATQMGVDVMVLRDKVTASR